MSKSTFLHLRLGFSLLLLPVFLFAACQAPSIDWLNFALAFTALHLFLYPATNAFNSYYDRDEGSIGLLQCPPPVEKELLWTSLALDAIALLLAAFVSWSFFAALLIYSACSKLYSHPAVRLKKRPVASLLGVALTQGALVFMASYYAVQPGSKLSAAPSGEAWALAGLASLALAGFYPITQIYQHTEDAKRGDKSMSMLLGVKGTIYFSSGVLTLCGALFAALLLSLHGALPAAISLAAMAPAATLFLLNSSKVLRAHSEPGYEFAMKPALLGAGALNAIGLCWLLLKAMQP